MKYYQKRPRVSLQEALRACRVARRHPRPLLRRAHERRMISAVVNRRSRPTSSLYDKLTVSSVKYGAGAGCIDS